MNLDHHLARMSPPLVTTRTGLVHREDCKRLRPVHDFWPWRPANDGPGVAKACTFCLKDGLP